MLPHVSNASPPLFLAVQGPFLHRYFFSPTSSHLPPSSSHHHIASRWAKRDVEKRVSIPRFMTCFVSNYQNKCFLCRKKEGKLLSCGECGKSIHYSCLDPPRKESEMRKELAGDTWLCHECTDRVRFRFFPFFNCFFLIAHAHYPSDPSRSEKFPQSNCQEEDCKTSIRVAYFLPVSPQEDEPRKKCYLKASEGQQFKEENEKEEAIFI